MSDKFTQGEQLQKLLELWGATFPKRAKGGWWALSGFSFQIAHFLLRFFKGLDDEIIEPGQLAQTERLSDILCPLDNCFLLIQVKRTLTPSTLKDALAEAYLITKLCNKHLPELLPSLRFQIICRYLNTSIDLQSIDVNRVITMDADIECWRKMMTQIDQQNPVLEEADPIGPLHVYLWRKGIRNTSEFIKKCHGIVLLKFDNAEEDEIRTLGYELASLYHDEIEKRKPHWKEIGKFIDLKEVTLSHGVKTGKVLTGEIPTFLDYREGCFKERSIILTSLWDSFEKWFNQLEQDYRAIESHKLPVFWIKGRSGAGKSVLLVQTVAKFVQLRIDESIIQLESPIKLITLLEQLPDSLFYPLEMQSYLFIMIDDLYSPRHRGKWEEELRDLLSIRTPPVAIITCGPSEQARQMDSHLGDLFSLHNFYVPSEPSQEEILVITDLGEGVIF